jgi:hypothetical protein
MEVIAKFRCELNEAKSKAEGGGSRIRLSAVTGGSAENESFFRYTPNATVDLQTVNEDAAKQFEVGKEYYVKFSKAG